MKLILLLVMVVGAPALGQHRNFHKKGVKKENVYVRNAVGVVSHSIETSEGNSEEVTTERFNGRTLSVGIGLDLYRAFQLSADYTSMDSRSTKSGTNALDGSMISVGGRFVFFSPISNFYVGGGAVGAIHSHQKDDNVQDIHETGQYLDLGLNRFLMETVSIFGETRISKSKLKSQGNNEKYAFGEGSARSVSIGVNLWSE